MTKYFFDISGVAWHLKRVAEFTGIQRAVTMIIDRMLRQIDPDQAYLGYFDKATGQYLVLAAAALKPGDIADPDRLRAALGYGRPKSRRLLALRRYADRPVKYWFHRTTLNLSALLGLERPFQRNNTTIEEWRRQAARRSDTRSRIATQRLWELAGAGDHLVLLDGTFAVQRAETVFREARQKGMRVSTMIHDLIPLVLPQVSSDLGALNYHEWLRHTELYTSIYLTNSLATKADLARFLTSYGIVREVIAVPLAQEALPAKPSGAVAGPLVTAINREAYPALVAAAGIDERVRSAAAFPYVLCVGTMEIRKNIWRIAAAWDQMRQMPGVELPKLVFAGRAGWMKQDFDDLIAGTGNLAGWVRVIEEPSDDELAYLYRNSTFTIMASLYEGWGLPVGESLSYGKTAVVSQTTSLPEVGGDLVEYCDPQSINSIVAACLRLLSEPARRIALEERIAAARLRRWDDVATDLLAAIRRAG